MKVELTVPNVGESVSEAVLAQWFKLDGDRVEADEPVFVIETDKVTLEVKSPASGRLSILVKEGETVPIGAVVGAIDTEGAAAAPEAGPPAPAAPEKPRKEAAPEAAETKAQPPPAAPASAPLADESALLPSVRRLIAEKGLDPAKIPGTGPEGRLTKGDVLLYLESLAAAPPAPAAPPAAAPAPEEAVTRKPMSPIRKRIAERLLAAKRDTAMLTTFNEIDMGRVTAIRDEHKDAFQKLHGVRLGFMSFFVKAVVAALKEAPDMNGAIENNEIVHHHYYHVGMAIGAEKGLVVPVIRHADRLTFAGIEAAVVEFVKKIKENRLALADLEGGTFSITNGGVYGSLLSTPILNPPQSGILGLHKIEDRPVAIAGQVVIRPMMYVALSYDHRIVDGKTAVTFLRRIKELVENPERLLLEV